MIGSIVERASGNRFVRNNCAACRYDFAICDVCWREDEEGSDAKLEERLAEEWIESSVEKEGIVCAIVVLPLDMFTRFECLTSHWKNK